MSDNSTSQIPEATISLNITLTDDYSIDEAQAAFAGMAGCLNRMIGVALTRRNFSVSHPVMQAALAASQASEAAAVGIEQLKQQQRQQSQIVAPQMGPVAIRRPH